MVSESTDYAEADSGNWSARLPKNGTDDRILIEHAVSRKPNCEKQFAVSTAKLKTINPPS